MTNNQLYRKCQQKLKGVTEVESYKAMCALLNEEYFKYKKSKDRQLEVWKTCFSYDLLKSGKFINIRLLSESEHFQTLTELFKTDSISYSLCGLLNQYSDETNESIVYITKSELAFCLGFFNESYSAVKKYPEVYSYQVENDILALRNSRYPFIKEHKDSIKGWRKVKENSSKPSHDTLQKVEDFTTHYSSNYEYKVENALKNLADSGYITLHEVYMGAFIDDNFNWIPNIDNISNKDGRYYFKSDETTTLVIPYKDRELTPEEEVKYIQITNEIFRQMNLDGIQDVFKQNKQLKFRQQLFPQLLSNMGCLYIYKAYRIGFSSEHIGDKETKVKTKLQSTFDIASLKKALADNNSTATKANLKNAQKRIEDNISSKHTLGNTLSESQKLEQEYSTFILKKLSKELLNIDVDSYFPSTSDSSNAIQFINSKKKTIFNNSLRRLNNKRQYDEKSQK